MSDIKEKQYIAIDLKSFYASVECAERGLDPLDANLVVADESRTDKTICLAVSPSLKALGISGRARLFEAKSRIREVNRERLQNLPQRRFTGKSVFASELEKDPSLQIDFVIAKPRMKYYMDYSTKIVGIYLRYISPDDILVYSVDEVFIDVTGYLKRYNKSAREIAIMLIGDVLAETNITATVGIGTNMFLAKVAMDIVAKHMPADRDGVRIAELDEMSYREKLWDHRPLTDFWRVGNGIAGKLARNGIFTMGEVARCSVGEGPIYNEDLLYKLFGVNAELLIDHAWGVEPTEIKDAHSYRPASNSISSGQVLSRPYSAEKGKLIAREMMDSLVLDLVRRDLVTNLIVLSVNYDNGNLTGQTSPGSYTGEVSTDYYGRSVPKPAHGSVRMEEYSSSTNMILDAVSRLYDSIVDKRLTVRRINVAACNLIPRADAEKTHAKSEQLDMFTDYEKLELERKELKDKLEKENSLQKALINVRDRFGANSIVRGMNLDKDSTAMERNAQIGGHKA